MASHVIRAVDNVLILLSIGGFISTLAIGLWLLQW